MKMRVNGEIVNISSEDGKIRFKAIAKTKRFQRTMRHKKKLEEVQNGKA
jgi:hypothetical protein